MFCFFPLTKHLVQLQIEDASRRLRSGDLGIPANPEERFDILIKSEDGDGCGSFTFITIIAQVPLHLILIHELMMLPILAYP